MCNEIEGSYDKIIITIVPSYTGKNITHLLPLALLLALRTRNNTDGNKLMIFSGIALYYGDTYIVSRYLIGNMCTRFYSQMFLLLVVNTYILNTSRRALKPSQDKENMLLRTQEREREPDVKQQQPSKGRKD